MYYKQRLAYFCGVFAGKPSRKCEATSVAGNVEGVETAPGRSCMHIPLCQAVVMGSVSGGDIYRAVSITLRSLTL